MSPRKQRVLAFALRLLGLLMIVVDLLKSGRSLSVLIPQTRAWDKVNDALYVTESFVSYNIGNLLPGHGWAILGSVAFIAGMVTGWRARKRKPGDPSPVDHNGPARASSSANS